jgi:hypothetical protein
MLGRALGFRDPPLLGGGLLQHQAHRGAAQAHRLDEVARRARAVGVLVAVFDFITLRLPDADLGPVSVELVGDHHRQRGAGCARAHLRARRNDRHDPIRRDRDEDVRIADRLVRHRLGAGRVERRRGERRETRGEHETAGREACQHSAPADINNDGGLRIFRKSGYRFSGKGMRWLFGANGHDQAPLAAARMA